MPSTYGQQALGNVSSQPWTLIADGDYRGAKPGGITIDWATVTAVGSDTTLPDGTFVKNGFKVLQIGQVMTQIAASGLFGPYLAGAAQVAAPVGAPTAAAAAGTTNFLAGNYQVAYSWLTGTGPNYTGQTTVSPATANIALTAGQQINTTIPALPANVTGAAVYVAPVGEPLQYAGTATAAGTFAVTGVALPTAYAGPYPPTANTAYGTLDGRQNLARGQVYLLNRTQLEVAQYNLVAIASNHPAAIEAGLVWKPRLLVGGAGQPTWAQLEAALPGIKYAQ